MKYENLSDSVNLLYSQLLQMSINEVPSLPSVCFTPKTIKKKKY